MSHHSFGVDLFAPLPRPGAGQWANFLLPACSLSVGSTLRSHRLIEELTIRKIMIMGSGAIPEIVTYGFEWSEGNQPVVRQALSQSQE